MIKVNGHDVEWVEGLTVAALLEKLSKDDRFTYAINSTTTVMINREVIPRNDYPVRLLQEGDVILLYPQLMGG
ncbi:sulfur carrier protein ThiS [Moorella sulfitireducens (nom. illeg.)]|uniref:sulfur carrier protein ThiS n=1 Tax=Neomoorella sulfitireducens TaxID=2972948 RepID=UPI0021ACD583|nr:sulfur carrier protein ThiS [Moorella sulfitireducens]